MTDISDLMLLSVVINAVERSMPFLAQVLALILAGFSAFWHFAHFAISFTDTALLDFTWIAPSIDQFSS